MPLKLIPRIEGRRLLLTGTLAAREKAVVGLSADLPDAPFPTAWPVLRVLTPARAYGFWRSVQVESLALRVSVAEFSGGQASNDLGPVVITKAF